MKRYDAIVLGLGAMGSAALFHLAKRGAKVLGVDPYPLGHDHGSSHGETRVIRLAYFEHESYVPLLRRAYQLWGELEAEWGAPLYHPCGVLQVGPPNGEIIPGLDRAAQRHGLPLISLSKEELAVRFPGFVLPEGHQARLEEQAGILRVEAAVRAHGARAQAHGAELRLGHFASQLAFTEGGVRLSVGAEIVEAQRLVLTAGPWAPALLSDLGVPFRLLRKASVWVQPQQPLYGLHQGAPAFLYETQDGVYYGLPAVSERGMKIAEHSGGAELSAPLPPSGPERGAPTAAEEARPLAFAAQHLPGLGDRIGHRALCMYTMTPDQHFLIDRHPTHPQLVFAAGFSGHGFKFATVVGEALAELSLEGGTRQPIGFLGLSRFAPVRR